MLNPILATLKHIQRRLKAIEARLDEQEASNAPLPSSIGRELPSLHPWFCPDCGNGYWPEDGGRFLTRSKICNCPSMPDTLRKLREKAPQRKTIRAMGFYWVQYDGRDWAAYWDGLFWRVPTATGPLSDIDLRQIRGRVSRLPTGY